MTHSRETSGGLFKTAARHQLWFQNYPIQFWQLPIPTPPLLIGEKQQLAISSWLLAIFDQQTQHAGAKAQDFIELIGTTRSFASLKDALLHVSRSAYKLPNYQFWHLPILPGPFLIGEVIQTWIA